MHGMLDTHSRIAFAREHAERLRQVMLASARTPRRDDDAGRREPARIARSAQLRTNRGTI